MHSLRIPTQPLMSVSRIFCLAVRLKPLNGLSDHSSFIAVETQMSSTSRHVELDVDIGADAKDWSAIQAGEKLKPVETELRRIEELVGEIVAEMDYLKGRETKLRDTNESTNERVKWFAFGTMGMLVGLGAWQVVYLRAYFRYVVLIPVLQLISCHANFHLDQSILYSALTLCIIITPFIVSKF